MSRTVWVILAVLAVAFAAITGLAVQRGVLGVEGQTAAIGGPFQLVDQAGKPTDQKVYISVDPRRDTPKVIANYLSNTSFPRRVVGLTGTPEQTAAAAKAYKVYVQPVGEGDGYQVNHSTVTYLMAPNGKFVCALEYGQTPEQFAAAIRLAMSRGPHATSCRA